MLLAGRLDEVEDGAGNKLAPAAFCRNAIKDTRGLVGQNNVDAPAHVGCGLIDI
jgi:hypothetical protein